MLPMDAPEYCDFVPAGEYRYSYVMFGERLRERLIRTWSRDPGEVVPREPRSDRFDRAVKLGLAFARLPETLRQVAAQHPAQAFDIPVEWVDILEEYLPHAYDLDAIIVGWCAVPVFRRVERDGIWYAVVS